MKILIDICHPAHVHFFKNVIKILLQNGHKVILTARDKECAINLLKHYKLPHKVLSAKKQSGFLGLFFELIQRDYALLKVIKKQKPDVVTAIGGTFAAHASFFSKVPCVIFYDSDNATLQNAITYPFANLIATPDAYIAKVSKKKHLKYSGFHELSYLAPKYFKCNDKVAIQNGININKKNFVLRLVSLTASHDFKQKGISYELLDAIIHHLKDKGNIIISTEKTIPNKYHQYLYNGSPYAMHHVISHSALYIGESATMAAEAAVLGVPAIYICSIRCGTITQFALKYSLVKPIYELNLTEIISAIDLYLSKSKMHWSNLAKYLQENTIDVADFAANTIMDYKKSLKSYQHDPSTFYIEKKA